MSELTSRERSRLRSWALDYGVVLAPAQLDLLGIYIQELLRWNEKVNLTGLSSRERILTELILDSLVPAPLLPDEGAYLDAGSGAGFPAIPLKICRPGLLTLLVESHTKRVSFLKHIARTLRLRDLVVLRTRMETCAPLCRPAGNHLVTSRALAPLPRSLALCAPLLCPGGMLINFQGNRFRQDLRASRDLMRQHGLVLEREIPYTLPGRQTPRHLLVFVKR